MTDVFVADGIDVGEIDAFSDTTSMASRGTRMSTVNSFMTQSSRSL
jgi:hypothetical protein